MYNKNFQISIKGLVFNKDNKVLILKEHDGFWDLPGGRLEHGETPEATLKRECEEELGASCEIKNTKPLFFWTGKDREGNWRALLCFKIELDSFNFKKSKEFVDCGYFGKDEIKKLNLVPQTKELENWL